MAYFIESLNHIVSMVSGDPYFVNYLRDATLEPDSKKGVTTFLYG